MRKIWRPDRRAAQRRPAIASARLLSRRRFLGGLVSGSGGVGRCVSGGFASSTSSVASSSGRVGRGLGGVASSFTRSGGGVLSSLGRRLVLLRAGGQRQRQRESSKNHFCVHVIYHPDVVVS
jgi:hypothetical protein